MSFSFPLVLNSLIVKLVVWFFLEHFFTILFLVSTKSEIDRFQFELLHGRHAFKSVHGLLGCRRYFHRFFINPKCLSVMAGEEASLYCILDLACVH